MKPESVAGTGYMGRSRLHGRKPGLNEYPPTASDKTTGEQHQQKASEPAGIRERNSLEDRSARWINFKRFVDTTPARRRRYQLVCRLVGLRPEHRVLDVGCGYGNSFEAFNEENVIVGVDLYPNQRICKENFRYVMADAESLDDFADKAFDVVVCIGVLEHIQPLEKLRKVAHEIQRVGRAYVVVVPHFFTLIEPHNQLPLWQFYPNRLKSSIRRRLSVGSYQKDPGGEIPALNYLPKEAWLSLFPRAEAVAHAHLWFGLIQDYILFRRT